MFSFHWASDPFVKWGAEVPLPPRTISDGRAEFNPPYIFLRDYLGIDPTQTVYTFAEHIINPVMVTHIIFGTVFVWLGLTPTWSHLPASEYISEIFGHIVWFWSIEMIRGYLREKMTKEPDPEVALS